MVTPLPPTPAPLLQRMRGEFVEMPGLCVTEPQAARLWNVEILVARSALRILVEMGVLRRTPTGHYIGAR